MGIKLADLLRMRDYLNSKYRSQVQEHNVVEHSRRGGKLVVLARQLLASGMSPETVAKWLESVKKNRENRNMADKNETVRGESPLRSLLTGDMARMYLTGVGLSNSAAGALTSQPGTDKCQNEPAEKQPFVLAQHSLDHLTKKYDASIKKFQTIMEDLGRKRRKLAKVLAENNFDSDMCPNAHEHLTQRVSLNLASKLADEGFIVTVPVVSSSRSSAIVVIRFYIRGTILTENDFEAEICLVHNPRDTKTHSLGADLMQCFETDTDKVQGYLNCLFSERARIHGLYELERQMVRSLHDWQAQLKDVLPRDFKQFTRLGTCAFQMCELITDLDEAMEDDFNHIK